MPADFQLPIGLQARGKGYSRFQVTGMIEWGQKSKLQKIPRASNTTQKNPWTKNLTQKNLMPHYVAGIHGHYHESSDCFEYPKKSLLKSQLKSSHTFQIFLPKKILDHPCHLKSEVPPPPRAIQVTLRIGTCCRFITFAKLRTIIEWEYCIQV